jgi:hypothetical protein
LPDYQGLKESVSLAEFARGIGLRAQYYQSALVKAGLVEVIEFANPLTGRMQLRVGSAAQAAFRARFVTVNILAAETGQHPNLIRKRMSRSGLSEFKKDGIVFANLWLRRHLEN